MITTMCHFCKWAKWSKDTQTGCDLGRLKKFKQRGAEVRFKDNDKSYQVNRMCNACRDVEWEGDIAQDIQIKHAVLAVDSDEISYEAKFNSMAKFIDHVCKFDILPHEIIISSSTFIVGNNLSNYWNKLSTLLNNKMTLTIVNSMSKKESDIINYGVNKCKSQFYSIHSLNDKPAKDLVKKLNFVVNEELYLVNMIKGDPLVFNTGTHKILGGNGLLTLEQKITELEKEQKTKTIHEWKKVCKNYRK